jgi:hypothetical protein
MADLYGWLFCAGGAVALVAGLVAAAPVPEQMTLPKLKADEDGVRAVIQEASGACVADVADLARLRALVEALDQWAAGGRDIENWRLRALLAVSRGDDVLAELLKE